MTVGFFFFCFLTRYLAKTFHAQKLVYAKKKKTKRGEDITSTFGIDSSAITNLKLVNIVWNGGYNTVRILFSGSFSIIVERNRVKRND